jgi:hypothetical protein
LAADFGLFKVTVYVFHESIGEVVYPVGSQEANARLQAEAEPNQNKLNSVLSLKSELITRFWGNVNGVSLNYIRGGTQNEGAGKSPVFDDLTVDHNSFDSDRIKIAARALELFRPVKLPQPADPTSLLESQRVLQEASFGRLQLQLEKVFEQTIDLRSQLDAQVRAKEASLEQVFKQKELEATQQHEKWAEELASKERALEEKRKSLDESDNTFARRKIRDQMLSDVSERVQNFGLSVTTVNARRPVAIGIFLLCLFLFCLLFLTSLELYAVRANDSLAKSVEVKAALSNLSSSIPYSIPSDDGPKSTFLGFASATEANLTERIMLWLRFTFLSIGLAASILYYIRWQNNWASTFAATEHSLQQFHIDVNRANWVVETCLEWRKETTSDLPAPLIESLTRGLFTGRETPATVLHPADELASALMGSASKLSLDLNGNKVEIDKPGKIPKSVTTGAGSPRQGSA